MLPKCMLPRCPITNMSVTKMSYYRNVLLPKCPVTEMSCYRNVSYQNVHYQSVLYRNVWIPFQTDCSGSPHPSRMRPRPPVISPGNFLMNNCSENADVSLRHKMIIHIKKNSCLHTLRLPRPSSSYTPPPVPRPRPTVCLPARQPAHFVFICPVSSVGRAWDSYS